MSIGNLILSRFNGREVYPITEAVIMLLQREEHVDVNLEIETGDATEKTTPEDLDVNPNVEVSVSMPSFHPDSVIGNQFSVPEGDVDGEWYGRLYYCEHEPLDNNIVEFVQRDGDTFHVRWRGDACDVNFYDGSKPRTKVEIEARFTLKR